MLPGFNRENCKRTRDGRTTKKGQSEIQRRLHENQNKINDDLGGRMLRRTLMVVLWNFLCMRIFAQEHAFFFFCVCVSSAHFCT